jgi:hypothetical protein
MRIGDGTQTLRRVPQGGGSGQTGHPDGRKKRIPFAPRLSKDGRDFPVPTEVLAMKQADDLSAYYEELLEGRYDCVDRIVLNGATFRSASKAGLSVPGGEN